MKRTVFVTTMIALVGAAATAVLYLDMEAREVTAAVRAFDNQSQDRFNAIVEASRILITGSP